MVSWRETENIQSDRKVDDEDECHGESKSRQELRNDRDCSFFKNRI
jgi:hypothetical protein